MVRLRDGQTIVLGGQRQTEQVVRGTGIPFLSSIPIIGWLFSNKRFAKVETQMMIFLTPHVYYGSENAVQPDDYFGDEINRMMDRHDPDRFRKRIEKRREERRRRKEAKERLERMRGEPETKRGFTWPWKRPEEQDPTTVDTTDVISNEQTTTPQPDDNSENKRPTPAN
jgi:Flp pilus assembly secretin CpaC